MRRDFNGNTTSRPRIFGRPLSCVGQRGAVIPSPAKTRFTIMLDDDVIEAFRTKAEAAGLGYQTLINEALRSSLGKMTSDGESHA